MKKEGFTLIEVLVVVAIIGLLSSVAIVGLGGARSKARDSRRIADIQQIQTALELAYDPAKGYPASLPANAPQKDPQGKAYLYYYDNTKLGYQLGICLENKERATGKANCSKLTFACDGKEYCVTQAGQ